MPRYTVRRYPVAWWLLLALTLCPALLSSRPVVAQKDVSAAPTTDAAPSEKPVILQERMGYIVPFTYDPPVHPFIVIQISINKSKPLPFILDTGTQSTLLLFPWAAEALHLSLDKTLPEQSDRGLARQLTADVFDVDLPTIVPSAIVPSANVNFQTKAWVGPFPPFENYTTPRIAGIMGMGIFDKVTVRFDFDTKTVTFFVVKHAPIQVSAPSVTLPMQKPMADYLRAGLSLQAGKSTLFMLDTGSLSSILPARESGKVAYLAEGGSSSDDVSGHHNVTRVLRPSLPLGGLSLPLVDFSIDPQFGQSILGLNVLSCFRVTMDTRNGMLILEPRRNAVKLQGQTDLLLEELAGQFFISSIERAASPVSLAVGDKLLSIDGKELAGLTRMEAYLLLDGYAGTKATLVVEKKDHSQVTLTWVRRSDFPTVVIGAAGLTLLQEGRMLPRIIGIVPGSHAERLGLHIGDMVVAVNARPAKQMTVSGLQELFATDAKNEATVETLLIQHKGEATPRKVKLKAN